MIAFPVKYCSLCAQTSWKSFILYSSHILQQNNGSWWAQVAHSRRATAPECQHSSQYGPRHDHRNSGHSCHADDALHSSLRICKLFCHFFNKIKFYRMSTMIRRRMTLVILASILRKLSMSAAKKRLSLPVRSKPVVSSKRTECSIRPRMPCFRRVLLSWWGAEGRRYFSCSPLFLQLNSGILW